MKGTTETWTVAQARAHFAKNKSKTKPHKPTKKRQVVSEIVQMELLLSIEKIPFVKEYRFHPTRKWRFDFAITTKKIAIEYEGIYGGGKSRHTTVQGYTGDTEKYNEAGKLGWTILRYTATSFTNLLNDLKPLFKNEQSINI